MTSVLADLPVAWLVPRWPPDGGGMAQAAARLARGLARHRSLEVFVPTTALASGITRMEEGACPTVVNFGAHSREESQRGWYECLTQRGPFGLVHAVYPSETGFVATLGARYLNIPCLLAARGNDLDRDAFRADRQAGLLHAVARADMVVGVSRDLARLAVALGAQRTCWIPNGVATELFHPVERNRALARRLGVADGAPLIAFMGEARRKKGLATMLDAFALLKNDLPAARLWLVGGVRADARLAYAAWQAASTLAAAGVTVQSPVQREDLPYLYALTDLLWHPSDQDGLPNAILEGLACGRLTVGSRAGGIPDVLDHGDLAELLVPSRDAAALASVTAELWRDGARRSRLEALAKARAASFNPEAEVAAYLALYDELCAATAGRTPSSS